MNDFAIKIQSNTYLFKTLHLMSFYMLREVGGIQLEAVAVRVAGSGSFQWFAALAE
jgi:hypothetical protein